MDIKDFILIVGGLLIAAVVAHGFWIAWRDRRQELRIDIKPHLIPDEGDDIERLRGELPNGGARLVRSPPPEQAPLDLDERPPLLLEPTDGPPLTRREAPASASPQQAEPEEVDALLFGGDWTEQKPRSAERTEPVLGTGEAPVPSAGQAAAPESEDAHTNTGARSAPSVGESSVSESARAKVAEVAMPDPVVAEPPKRPRRLAPRKQAERGSGPLAGDQGVPGQAKRQSRSSTGGSVPRTDGAERGGRGRRVADTGGESVDQAAIAVEELIVMIVLAEPGSPYTGDELFTALRSCGLKFGNMNIFHRVEPLSKVVQYSVASAVEPGTFDMADMESIRCPGLCMFMQLPGPEDPAAAFEDMLSVARSVTRSLGGVVTDEHRNVMTPQTVEHYRQRIVEFSRRRMSKRA